MVSRLRTRNTAIGNPLADRSPYRGVKQFAESGVGGLGEIFEGFAAQEGSRCKSSRSFPRSRPNRRPIEPMPNAYGATALYLMVSTALSLTNPAVVAVIALRAPCGQLDQDID
jgi:hypothetical protein